MRQWRKDHPDYIKGYNKKKYTKFGDRYRLYARKYNLKKKYGITEDQYEVMLKLQGGHCKICPNKPGKPRLCVDHDHDTGEVRALLCRSCNTRLFVLENWEYREEAEKYLEFYKNQLTLSESHVKLPSVG